MLPPLAARMVFKFMPGSVKVDFLSILWPGSEVCLSMQTMSLLGQERRIGPVCRISTSPPTADMRADTVVASTLRSESHTAFAALRSALPFRAIRRVRQLRQRRGQAPRELELWHEALLPPRRYGPCCAEQIREKDGEARAARAHRL